MFPSGSSHWCLFCSALSAYGSSLVARQAAVGDESSFWLIRLWARRVIVPRCWTGRVVFSAVFFEGHPSIPDVPGRARPYPTSDTRWVMCQPSCTAVRVGSHEEMIFVSRKYHKSTLLFEPATHYLARDFARTDNIPAAYLMIRKLPCAQQPWDIALTSNLSVDGLCQLIYLVATTVQPRARIADLRVECKQSKLLKRLVNAFNAVKMEQTHWNRACTMTGSGIPLLTEGSLSRCALQLGWQPAWMTETQNSTRRTVVPAAEYGAVRSAQQCGSF